MVEYGRYSNAMEERKSVQSNIRAHAGSRNSKTWKRSLPIRSEEKVQKEQELQEHDCQVFVNLEQIQQLFKLWKDLSESQKSWKWISTTKSLNRIRITESTSPFYGEVISLSDAIHCFMRKQ
eukprot:6787891-Ditylum_brightwellii.AAC.1